MSEMANAWARFVAFFIVGLLAVAVLLGYPVYSRLAASNVGIARSNSQTFAQIQEQLAVVEKRLEVLESHRKAESTKAPPDMKAPEAIIPTQDSTTPAPRARYHVSPESALPTQPLTAQQPVTDPSSAQRFARLQQGLGALQEEAALNREAWQANTDRLAEVAGELGAQHGQILKNHDELDRFLGQTEHTTLTFELRRGSVPESVGPVRISLKASNQKSQRYTVCVYLKASCVQMRDRVLYEVVEFAVAKDIAPFELIATKVDKDGIAGYLEVPTKNAGH